MNKLAVSCTVMVLLVLAQLGAATGSFTPTRCLSPGPTSLPGAPGRALTMSTGCEGGGPVWQDFHSVDLAEVLFPDRPTLIQVTADWCVTCIVNEQKTLNAPEAARLYDDRGIQLIRADLAKDHNWMIRGWLDWEGLEGNLPIYLFFTGEDPPLDPWAPDPTVRVRQSTNRLYLEELRDLTTL